MDHNFAIDQMRPLTTGIRSELITANDGVSLLGIRVLWTVKPEYSRCYFTQMRVELYPGPHTIIINEVTADVRDSSADFFNIDCNREYTPSVVAVISKDRQIQDTGDTLFYGGIYTCNSQELQYTLSEGKNKYTSLVDSIIIE